MKRNTILVVTSLLSMLTLHITDDIVRGISKAEPSNTALLVLVALLYGTLVLPERRSGHVIMLLDGYSLLSIRAGQLGPSLRRSSADCEKAFLATPRCREGFITKGAFKVVGAPLYTLVNVIVNQVRTPVLDQTQLGGTFDLDLHWSPDLGETDDATSIFTALKEQLGLKLERTRVPTEMFVIDHVERPTRD